MAFRNISTTLEVLGAQQYQRSMIAAAAATRDLAKAQTDLAAAQTRAAESSARAAAASRRGVAGGAAGASGAAGFDAEAVAAKRAALEEQKLAVLQARMADESAAQTAGAIRNAQAQIAEQDKLAAAQLRNAEASGGFIAGAEDMAATNGRAARSFGLLGVAVGAVGVGFMVYGVKSAMAFEQQMRNVESVMYDNTMSAHANELAYKNLSAGVLSLSEKYPVATKELAEAAFDVASAGFKGNDAMTVLTAGARAAAAGSTDVRSATRLLIGTMNAYGMSAGQAQSVANVLFLTHKDGITTFSEMTKTLSKVIPIAGAAGVSLKDMGGAIATVTRAGAPIAQATTGLASLLSAFIKPNAALQTVVKQTTGMTTQQAIANGKLYPTIMAVAKADDFNAATMAKQFINRRALVTMLELSAGQGKNYANVMKDFSSNEAIASAEADALAQQQKSLAYQVKVAENNFKALAISVGDKLIPVLKPVAQGFADVFKTLNDLPGPVKAALGIFAGLSGVMLTVGGAFLLLAPRIVAMKAAMAGASDGARLLGGAFGAASKAMGVLGLAVAAGIAIYEVFHAKTQQIKDLTDNYTSSLGSNIGKLDDANAQAILLNASHDRALSSLDKLANGTELYTKAVEGNSGAADTLRNEMVAGYHAGQLSGLQIINLNESLKNQSKAYQAATKDAQANAHAQGDAGKAASSMAQANQVAFDALAAYAAYGTAVATGDLSKLSAAQKQTLTDMQGFLNDSQALTDVTPTSSEGDPATVLSSMQSAAAAAQKKATAEANAQIRADARAAAAAQRADTAASMAADRAANATALSDQRANVRDQVQATRDGARAEVQAQADRVAALRVQYAEAPKANRDSLRADITVENERLRSLRESSSANTRAVTAGAAGDLAAITADGRARSAALSASGRAQAAAVAASQRVITGIYAQGVAATAVSLKDYQQGLNAQITAQAEWNRDLDKITEVGGATFADTLRKMGSKGFGLVHQLATGTDQQITNMASSFAKLAPDAQQSLNDFTAVLAQQVKDAASWASNLATLAARGRMDLVAQFEKLGPQAAGLVAQAAVASDAQLDKLSGIYNQRGVQLGTDLDTNLKVLAAIAGAGGKATVASLAKEFNLGIPQMTDLLNGLDASLNSIPAKKQIDLTLGINPPPPVTVKVIASLDTALSTGTTAAAGAVKGLAGFAVGGHVRGPGTGTSDDVPAWLSNGEYVLRAAAVDKIGVKTLDKLNHADRAYAAGGYVSATGISDSTPLLTETLQSEPGLLKQLQGYATQQVNSMEAAGGIFDANAMIQFAETFVGKTPYLWGGTTPAGWDCSGFTQYVYRHFGIDMPRTANAQQDWATPSGPTPGGLVFFGRPAHHVGLVTSTGHMVNAEHTGTLTMNDSYGWPDMSGFGMPPGGLGKGGAGVTGLTQGYSSAPSGIRQYGTLVSQVLAMLGMSPDLEGRVMTQMALEDGSGDLEAVNKNDINWTKYHTPSVGLMQVIGPTFAANAGPFAGTGPFLYGVSINPEANIYAGLHYALEKYGPTLQNSLGGLGEGHGYNTGGPVWGTPGVDKVPARLSNGEYVIRAAAAEKIGTPALDMLNHAEKFATGGKVVHTKAPVYHPAAHHALSSKGVTAADNFGVVSAYSFNYTPPAPDTSTSGDSLSSIVSALLTPDANGHVKFSFTSFDKALATAKRKLGDWQGDLASIAKRAGQDVADTLAGLGESQIGLVDRLARTSGAQFNKLIAEIKTLQGANGGPSLASYGYQLSTSVASQARFESYLEQLALRGQGKLAQQIAALGADNGMTIAQQAVSATPKQLNAITSSLDAGGALANGDLALLLQVETALRSQPQLGVQAVATMTGASTDDVVRVLRTQWRSVTRLPKKDWQVAYADVANAVKGQPFSGVGTGGGYPTSPPVHHVVHAAAIGGVTGGDVGATQYVKPKGAPPRASSHPQPIVIVHRDPTPVVKTVGELHVHAGAIPSATDILDEAVWAARTAF